VLVGAAQAGTLCRLLSPHRSLPIRVGVSPVPLLGYESVHAGAYALWMLEHPADEIPNRLFDLLSPKTLLLAGIGALPGARTEIVVVAMAAFQLSGARLHLPPAPAAHEASQLPLAALVLPLAPRPAVHRAPCEIHERARNVGGDGRGYPLFSRPPLERPRLPVVTPAAAVRLGDGA